MNWTRSLRTRWATSIELIRGLWGGPFWWMVPFILMLLPLSVLFVVLQAFPLIAPFFYVVF